MSDTTTSIPASSHRSPPAKPGANPVWVREMRQFARLTRTPVLLMTVTMLAALLFCSVGGVASHATTPASTGVALFHGFFSLAFFGVAFAGPAMAANSIASEREGRTWEALLLTGLSPTVVARGKFLAAYTHVALYLVMLAPVGALPFLFGGVTTTEVITAYLWLFVLAGLAVAFGLAVSSKMDTMRSAILVTLLVAFFLVPPAFGMLGPGLSYAAHAAWPEVPEGPPVWLPTAYARASFSWEYVGALIAAPIAASALPAWFFYEATVANLTSVTEDRSTGLRRWFVVTTAIIALGGMAFVVGAPAGERSVHAAIAQSILFTFLVFVAFVFAGEPIAPSKRVLARWDRDQVGWLARTLGPGVMRAALTLLSIGLLAQAALMTVSLLSLVIVPRPRPADVASVVIVGGYAASFMVFLAGFGAFVRARSNLSTTTRVMLLVMLFGVGAGPWILAAIAGAVRHDEGLLLAAPSPIFALVAAADVRRALMTTRHAEMIASISMSALWALGGLVLLARAASRCRAIVHAHDEALRQGDAMLAAEDAALAAAPSPPEPAPPAGAG
jgi:hypothetical protein